MSKSRGNAIALSDTADETARFIRGALTDSRWEISYDPQVRPEVSSLVLLAALCLDRDVHAVASEIGAGGFGALKNLVTEAVNQHLALSGQGPKSLLLTVATSRTSFAPATHGPPKWRTQR